MLLLRAFFGSSRHTL